jgi:DNA-3-methyladenine glycosylase II
MRGVPRPSAGSRTKPVEAAPAAIAHLRDGDRVLGELIERIGPLNEQERRRGRPPDAYGALLRAIVGQQLSTQAARTIYGRLAALFDDHAPTPAELLESDPEKIRSVGLSRPKVAYLRDLAARIEDGELDLERLPELDDEQVSTQLTAVKGLGQWTADMFLIFHLGRPDVLPAGDLGIRKAARELYRLRKLPEKPRLERLARPWRPHRSLASLYLWRSLDNEPA